MKKLVLVLGVVSMFFVACNTPTESVDSLAGIDTCDATNNFYDNEKTTVLPGSNQIEIAGEVDWTGIVSFDSLPLRTVIVKETELSPDSTKFIGAYRYDGYSLYDILNYANPQKLNAEEFPPIIDLYIEIENDKGEKVVLSWGEIYYPIHLHEVLIGTQVMNIVPSKTLDQWPLPEENRLIVASDLATVRNISNPVKITVKSLVFETEIIKGKENMNSDEILVKTNMEDSTMMSITDVSEYTQLSYPNIFYGRGRGIHSVKPWEGPAIKEIFENNNLVFADDLDALQRGLFIFTADDGYRAAFTYSELMNRNDQSEVILIDMYKYLNEDEPRINGRFKVYPAAGFFSDRAIKSPTGIYFRMVD